MKAIAIRAPDDAPHRGARRFKIVERQAVFIVIVVCPARGRGDPQEWTSCGWTMLESETLPDSDRGMMMGGGSQYTGFACPVERTEYKFECMWHYADCDRPERGPPSPSNLDWQLASYTFDYREITEEIEVLE